MPTFNSASTLKTCLTNLKNQIYDHSKIELIVADGGSTDNTLKILRQFKAKIIHESTKSPESAKALALKKAKNKLILFLASDNILPHKNWLQQMIKPFKKHSNLTGTYPIHYLHRPQDPLLTRYFALLGANDTLAWFLGKADRQSYLTTPLKKPYQLIKFTKKNLPTLGDNGFFIKRKILLQAKIDQKKFSHIDICLDLAHQNQAQYALVNTNIIHLTGSNLLIFLKKRYRYLTQLYFKNPHRRYFICKLPQDFFKISLYSLYSLTFIGPLIYSSLGFLKKPDPAWFLHPIVCFSIFWTYSLSSFHHVFTNFIKKK